MATLCVCFAVLMGLVIAVFMVLLYAMNERNQSLNDRLVEYAIKDRDRQSVAVPAVQPQTDAALKAMTETLATLQRQLAEERRQKAVAPVAPAKTPQQIAAEEQQRAEQERLIREKARLEAEKKLLAEEKERLRQQEVEQHRRRLYPDYYAQQEKQQAAPAAPSPRAKPAAAKKAELSDEDIADILRDAREIRLLLSRYSFRTPEAAERLCAGISSRYRQEMLSICSGAMLRSRQSSSVYLRLEQLLGQLMRVALLRLSRAGALPLSPTQLMHSDGMLLALLRNETQKNGQLARPHAK
jgi:hypothetical protein